MRRALAAVLVAAAVLTAGGSVASAARVGSGAPGAVVTPADSFTPVTLAITVAPVARRAAALPIRVVIHADAGVLDSSGEGPMRMEVKLASECGGDFQHTDGTTLMNLALAPAPATGRTYGGTLTAAGRPSSYGVQSVCAYLEDSTVGRVYANDESLTVNVSALCTAAGQRYDAAARALSRAQRALRHADRRHRARARRVVSARRSALALARRRGRAACGPGVAL